MIFDTDEALAKLDHLRNLDPSYKLFGAEEHRYKLRKPVSERTIAKFEKQHTFELPADYRAFLLRMGNGGAGPCYGIFRFQDYGKDRVVELSKPFPHSAAWNMPKEWFHNLPNPWPKIPDEALAGKTTLKAQMEVRKAYPADQQLLQRRRELTDWYFSSEHSTGAIPICHEGCGYLDFLVLRGPTHGTIWCDGRVSDQGIHPVQSPSGDFLTFGDWYTCWLEESIAEIGKS